MPMSILRYPEGTSNCDTSGAPSLTLLNSMPLPSADSVFMGKCSFWSTQAVLVPDAEVSCHLSQARPLIVSVPTFLQVAAVEAQGLLGSNLVGMFGVCRIMGLVLPCTSINMCCACITI